VQSFNIKEKNKEENGESDNLRAAQPTALATVKVLAPLENRNALSRAADERRHVGVLGLPLGVSYALGCLVGFEVGEAARAVGGVELED
jgi:hypothetical protein